MAHYITDSLEYGEQIIFQGYLHWTSVYKYIFSALLMLLMAIGLFAVGYFTTHQELYFVGAIFMVLAVIIYIIGWVFWTRCEFVVTDCRFIQNDGVLNIRMPEIPFFKIETVNFLQTFWQRVLGIGSIELVGSSGTSHRVYNVAKPLAVRKIIVGAINRSGKSNI